MNFLIEYERRGSFTRSVTNGLNKLCVSFFDLYHHGEAETFLPPTPRVDDPFMRKVWHPSPGEKFFWISLQQECISCAEDTLRRGSDRNRARRGAVILKTENATRVMKYREFLQAYGGFVLYSSTVRENRIDFHPRVIFWIKDGWIFLFQLASRIFIHAIFLRSVIIHLLIGFFCLIICSCFFFFSLRSKFRIQIFQERKKLRGKITLPFVLLLG